MLNWRIMKHDSGHELIARAVIIDNERLLVNKSINKKTGEEYYALPGGHIDPGESCAAAAQREFREELDASISVHDLCLVTESIYPGRKAEDTKRHEVVLYFHAVVQAPLHEEQGRIHSPERNKNFRWLPVKDLPTINLLPTAVKQFLLNIKVSATPEPESSHYVFEDSTKT